MRHGLAGSAAARPTGAIARAYVEGSGCRAGRIGALGAADAKALYGVDSALPEV